jgi:chromosomal replication initiator protein
VDDQKNTQPQDEPADLTKTLWSQFIDLMREKSGDDFTMYITPLQLKLVNQHLLLYAPNDFVYHAVKERYLDIITQHFDAIIAQGTIASFSLTIGSSTEISTEDEKTQSPTSPTTSPEPHTSHLNNEFVFESFVAGKSNQLAHAAADQVSNNPGAYNPLLIYGGVGLGKTHLMHAVGNRLVQKGTNNKILYQSSEGFVAQMVRALQTNTMEKFKTRYRSLSALLIDDIQFFAGKERSQEEFFHTFNVLFDSGQQIILTCDRYPKEIRGLEERLKSRFGWGLAVAVEPPDLETRVAILKNKAEHAKIMLPDDVAFFIAKHVQSNVRELEGALKRLIANANFTGSTLNIDFAKEALKDIIAVYAKIVSVENIQQTVADFYKIKICDLLSKRRTRVLTRPRQIAMALSKQMTSHSLPEIGKAFGGRDHTTVLHATRLVLDLIEKDTMIKEDYQTLVRILSS